MSSSTPSFPFFSSRPLRRSAAVALSAAILAGGGVVAAPAYGQGGIDLPALRQPVLHDGAPVPAPFGPDAYVGYISDISPYTGGIYYDVVKGFEDLRANHADVLAKNLDTTVGINNGASPEVVHRAQTDAAASEGGLLTSFSDALGADLGAALRTSLEEGRLPRTQMVLDSGYLSRAGGIANSTLVEKMIFNYDRPFVVAPDRIVRHDDGVHEFYDAGSKAFPSGHTNQAAWVTTLLAAMLPELGPQILDRGAEAGYNRMVMGVHYPLDVIGGRMTGTAAAADRLNDPKMRDTLRQAGDELRAELEWRTGRPLAETLAQQQPYRDTASSVREYADRMHYEFGTIYDPNAPMVVPQAAPALLITRFPNLDYHQRAEVLRQTAGPAGFPLDDQSPAGSWQRIDLAAAYAANVTVGADGAVTVS